MQILLTGISQLIMAKPHKKVFIFMFDICGEVGNRE